jgi:hypothetical protein
MYKETKISLIINSGKVLTAGTKLAVRKECSMSSILFNLYLDDDTRQWQSQLKILYIPDNLNK